MEKLHLLVGGIRKQIQRDKKIIIASVVGGLLVTAAAGITKTYSETIQTGIADSVVRFHVLANSDSPEDQQLKLKVRDAVLLEMKGDLESAESKEETKEILEGSLNRIRNIALNELRSCGSHYNVSVFLTRDLFPMKVYGDVAFPAGMYDALRIEIGSAEGQNWWCVMFPPLCFVDASCDTLSDDSKKDLKNVLTEEEYQVVASNETKETFVPQIKFKVVEWWQERMAGGRKYVTKK